MAEFSRSLHRREINGKSFDDLNGKATKDKAVVLNKINHLEKLMNEYLGTGKEAGPVDVRKEHIRVFTRYGKSRYNTGRFQLVSGNFGGFIA